MAEDLGTRPEDARVAALIAAADRLATPLDLDRLDRRPVRRGGVLAAIVVAGVLLALVTATTLSGGDDATADDDTTTPATVQRTATTRADESATTAGGAASAASVPPARAGTASTTVDSADDDLTTSTAASLPVGAPTGASPNAAQGNAPSTSTPVATTAAPVPTPGNLPGSPPTSAVGGVFTSAGEVTLAGGDAPVGTRSIVFVDGVLHLRGRVPDRATAAGLEENVALAAVGRAVVSAEYVVDDDAADSDTDVLTTEGTTLFLPESEDITPAAVALLDIGGALLREHPRMTWTVEVHTDNLGSDSYNLTLSQRRADAMVAALVSRGANPAQLLAVGKGEAEPIADNATRPGREANRRVEIEIGGLLG